MKNVAYVRRKINLLLTGFSTDDTQKWKAVIARWYTSVVTAADELSTCSHADLKPAGTALINYGAVDQYLLNVYELFITRTKLNSTGDEQMSIRLS